MAFLYLIFITAAEILTALWNPQEGIIFHSIILVTLIFHGALTRRTPQRRFLLALTIAPLIRILSVSLPLAKRPLTEWYIDIGSLLFVAVILAAQVTGIKPNRLGLRITSLRNELAISLIGPILGLIEFYILTPAPLIARLEWSSFWFPALSLLIFTGFLEELIFRGLIQEASTSTLGRLGLIYTALLFAILHIGYQSVVDVIFVFGAGLMFGLIAARTRSIIGVSLAHGLTNITLYLIYPFLFANLTSSSPQSMPQVIFIPHEQIPRFHGSYITPTPTSIIPLASTTSPLIPEGTSVQDHLTIAPTTVPCSPPADWVQYTVQHGDTLETLSLMYGISIDQIRFANCLDKASKLESGQTIFLPPSSISP